MASVRSPFSSVDASSTLFSTMMLCKPRTSSFRAAWAPFTVPRGGRTLSRFATRSDNSRIRDSNFSLSRTTHLTLAKLECPFCLYFALRLSGGILCCQNLKAAEFCRKERISRSLTAENDVVSSFSRTSRTP